MQNGSYQLYHSHNPFPVSLLVTSISAAADISTLTRNILNSLLIFSMAIIDNLSTVADHSSVLANQKSWDFQSISIGKLFSREPGFFRNCPGQLTFLHQQMIRMILRSSIPCHGRVSILSLCIYSKSQRFHHNSVMISLPLLSSAGRAQDCNCSTSNRYLEARGSIPRGETILLHVAASLYLS